MPLKSLSEALYDTVHRSKKPAKQIADECGISYNYLMRMAMDTSSGVDFNLKFLVPVMKASGQFDALKVLNALCGFLPPVRPPRGWKERPSQPVHSYQQQFNHTIGLLLTYLESPSEELYKAVNQALLDHMSDTEALRRSVQSKQINQGELF